MRIAAGHGRVVDAIDTLARAGNGAVDRLRGLIAQEPATFSRSQWLELREVLNDPGVQALGLTMELPGRPHIADTLTDYWLGHDTIGPTAEAFIHLWRAELRPWKPNTETARSWLRTLAARPADSIALPEWMRAYQLLAGAGSTRVGVTTELRGMRPFGRVLPEFVSASGVTGTTTRRYLSRWQAELDDSLHDPRRAQALVDRIVESDPSAHRPADWSRLRLLLERDSGRGSLGLDVSIPGTKPLGQVLDGLIEGARPRASLWRYLDHWRLARDPDHAEVEVLRSWMQRFSTRDVRNAPVDEWARARTLMAREASDRTLGMTLEIDGLPTASALVDRLLDGEGRVEDALQVYVLTWARELDPTWRSSRIDAFRSMLARGQVPDGATLLEAQHLGIANEISREPAWRAHVLRAVLDQPRRATIEQHRLVREARAVIDHVRAPDDPALRATWEEIARLVARNEARIADIGTGGVRDGLAGHPDYADLGRIRSVFQLVAATDEAAVTARTRMRGGNELLAW